MLIRRSLFLTGVFLLVVCGAARAQDTGKAGVTLAYPGSIGFIWHAGDSVAIRPDFTFSHSSTDSTIGTSGSHNNLFGTDISVLFYLKKYDNVRAYISPRFSYSRTSSTSTPVTTTQAALPEITITGTTTGGAGVFGAQYSPSKRFSVFGEAGIGFSHRKTDSAVSLVTSLKGNTWGTTAGVGVIFYP
jgi:opacity protein-like surface antigen